MIDDATLRAGLATTLEATDFATLGLKHEGKVRDSYVGGGRRVIVVTDRISAFDRVLGTIPFKGQVLNRMAAFWFERTRAVAPSHLLRVPDANVMECVECDVLPVEFVMRAYVTGVTSTSIWTAYARGERVFCGNALPERLRKHDRLPEPILTPSTKAPKGEHDRSVSRDEILREGKLTAERFDEAAHIAHKLFKAGAAHDAARGLNLVDTKYEMGVAPDGRIVVVDEIHTPDSSRYWHADTYDAAMRDGADPRALDKEYVRRWLSEHGYRGEGPAPALPDEVRIEATRRYVEACERITGEPFVPDTREPVARIRAALGIA